MDFILTRTTLGRDGIFGNWTAIDNSFGCKSAEHAYVGLDGSYMAKIPYGTYQCLRGEHQLEGMTESFITFQIMNVPGHTAMLCHFGNYPQVDSDGCVLLGENIVQSNEGQMVTASRFTFAKFMAKQVGCDSFVLTVMPKGGQQAA